MTMSVQPSIEKLCANNSYLRGCPSSAKPSIKTKSQKVRKTRIKKHRDIIQPSSDSNLYINQEKENTELQKERQAEAKKHHDIIQPSSDTNPYINMVKTYAVSATISNIMQNTLNTIQSGTQYLGQTALKNAPLLMNFATTNPMTTTAIGLGALGILYRTFKNKNDTDKDTLHPHKT